MMWNKRGFSLVEALVAIAILSGAIMMSMDFLSNQVKSRGQREKQSVHRYIAIQVTQHINANWPLYPPIIPSSPTQKVIYVGCLTKEGQLIGNFSFNLVSNFNERASINVCPPEKTHYEARFFWINPSQDEVKINLLTRHPGSATFMAIHNFKIFAK